MAHPRENLQLLAVAYAAAKYAKKQVAVVRILIAREDESVPLFARMDGDWMERVLAELREIYFRTQLPSPAVPGEHCSFCPALGACPQTAQLSLIEPGDAVRWTTQHISPENDAKMVTHLPLLEKAVEAIRDSLKQRAPIQLPNGKVWRETKQKYIWYRTHDGTTWRVPTHGKIFAIIDYGRAIFRIHNKHWLSDEFLRSEDAGGQYNYGPIYDKTRPKVMPNRSFDLCRLAISVLDGLYPDELPDEVEGGKTMSGDDDWIMRETKSALCNLLWSWTVDDAGKTVYTDAEGEDPHPGFDLYVHIAAHCHAAVPVEQLRQPAFDQFKTDERPEKGTRVYML